MMYRELCQCAFPSKEVVPAETEIDMTQPDDPGKVIIHQPAPYPPILSDPTRLSIALASLKEEMYDSALECGIREMMIRSSGFRLTIDKSSLLCKDAIP